MAKEDHSVQLTEVLRGGKVQWDKPKHRDVMEHIRSHNPEIIYEDEHVIAYIDDEDSREEPAQAGEKRISISPKNSPPSLMDLDITDAKVATHLLFAIQQVTYKLGLYKTGFEIRANVLPPYQQNPFIKLKIRTGDPKKSKAAAAPDAPAEAGTS